MTRRSISFRASARSRRPSDAVRHLYLAGVALPAARRLVASAEAGETASDTFTMLPGNGGLLGALAASGYDAIL
ncbi:hypothetical protein HFO56_23680 [Rhizobium laguerreae]|uniref:hypothetical protein n=1 Tax=Rhizobium laguerreae TaxID=1076926 RepID=UPI001C913175|nr:hypothetical protein [Rhizobium laguerreae]MBY3155328.1 hypothetical protein [Rhizobium laguerreae]